MNVLSATRIVKAFGEHTVLDGVTLGLDAGAKLGLIGDNGAGKSTLLKILAGILSADGGEVARRSGQKLAYLAQAPELEAGRTAREVLEAVFEELARTIERYNEAAQNMDEAADELLERVELLGGWDWQHKVDKAAEQAGVTDLDARVETMSGGQKKRVALARLLLQGPHIVLLDEPTNHLDAETVEWLEEWLDTSPAACIIVTHDRYFLDRVVRRMAEVRDGQLTVYEGNYTAYLEARAAEEELRERTRERRLNILKSELEWARRSPKARTTKSKSRLGRVDDLKREVRRLSKKGQPPEIEFGDRPRLGKTILELRDLTKGFGEGDPLFAHLNLILRKGDRLGIIGPNGIGKSTLLKLVAGTLSPDGGSVELGKNTSVAYFDQERAFVDPDATVREVITPDGNDWVFPEGQKTHAIAWMARFGFPKDTHRVPVATLSGGERNRLALCRFLLTDANLLLLDEPTNDLDIVTLGVLEEALIGFGGCVLVVSHDRYFLDRIATGIVAFEHDPDAGGRGAMPVVSFIEGDYTTYRRLRLDELEARREAAARAADEARRAARAEARAADRTKKKALTYAEEKELAGLDDKVEAAEAIVADLEQQLADPALWTGDGARGRELQAKLDEAKAAAEALYERWEELSLKAEG